MKRVLLTSLILVGLMGCQDDVKNTTTAAAPKPVAPQADVNKIKAHIEFLADDLLEGRDTGSRGHEIAARYIASQFTQLNLKPAGDDGSYLQRIPFRQAFLEQDSPKLSLTTAEGTQQLEYPKEYITGASTVSENSAVEGKLVFVGYGIIAPELNHDDYADLDVDGKIVVMLTGKPKSFPSEEGAHFASRYEKARYAAEHGAIGMITISTPLGEKVRPYQNLLNYIHTPRVSWLDKEGNPHGAFPQIKDSAYFSKEAAAKLFAGAQKSLDDIYAELEDDKSPKGFALDASINMSKTSTHKAISSPNVAAVLTGSDPELRKEFVVYSAHSDHIGIAKTVKKDKINNGAMDNATGTAMLIETARLMSQGPAPKRSVLFLAVTGEEKGLLGADYYAHNPTVPIKNIVADVNLDMPVLTYEFSDIIAFGANHSDLNDTVSQAAKNAGLTLSPDPMPEQAIFTRSDHYAFVKQGVPSVFVIPGWTSTDPNVDGGKMFNEFLHTNYHKPSDDMSQDFNWNAAKKFAEVNLEIGTTIANQTKRPAWNQGDFFGDTFTKK
ncbi:M28 family peptidase [Neptunicella marina]|uniref:M28 family peptidase n=1 Tax=Neptunicella marina TaxID=2125989 RepID=A0A8J6ISC8_9ALTE|nr:M28 family metallopeptidase [Neptunicella marina]MBC3765886.1 M28 family peptidase [Neptunicella marina]